jgi:hypothetical protein
MVHWRQGTLADGIGRALALAVAAAALLFLVTQVPLMPMTIGSDGTQRVVPIDTWIGATFPAARDLYRQHFAALLLPKHLPLLAAFGVLLALIARSFPDRLSAWIERRVPKLSPRALGAYRLALGLALAAAVASEVPASVPLDLQRGTSWLARLDWIRGLAANAEAIDTVRSGTIILFLAFAIGLWSRAALVLAAVALTIFIAIGLTAKAMHDWGLPLVTVWTLAVVPWHDSVGAQMWIARRLGRPLRPVSASSRGLAVWLPGLTIGIALVAAAFAKLDTSGLAWITGGAVRFHFVEDAAHAPVSWGLWIARSSAAAVAMSAIAILIEGTFWLVTLTSRAAVRAVFGFVGVSLLIGFYVFQGVFWPAWWALFLAFVPWSIVDRTRESDGPADGHIGKIPTLAAAAVALIVLQQPIVSALRFESEPFVSDYSMYAYTWPSVAAFDAHLRSKATRYEVALDGQDGDVVGQRLRQLPRGAEIIGDAISRTDRGEPWPPATREDVAAVRRAYVEQFGTRLSRVTVNVWQRGFDWERGAFDERPRLTARHTLDLDRERFDDSR